MIYASKAFPCTAVFRLFAEEGLSADVASGGELHLALGGRLRPARIYMHGNNKTPAELDYALEAGVGHIVVDSFDEIERLRGRGPRVLLRVTPGIRPSTHSYIQTGQEDSKFGFGLDDVPRAVDACARRRARAARAARAHRLAGVRARGVRAAAPRCSPGWATGRCSTWAAAWGSPTRADDRPPSIEEYVDALLRGAPDGVTVLCEPGRSLVGNAGVTIYTVGTVKRIPGVRTYVAVDGGMSDNLRPMLYGARYEAEIADRFGGADECTIAGMHCESGDILVRDALLDDPRPGDVLVMPATGAYGHAMANNYNALPRPPVIFCRDGDARVVVRRETYDDLTARDV